jgi:phasin family protein
MAEPKSASTVETVPASAPAEAPAARQIEAPKAEAPAPIAKPAEAPKAEAASVAKEKPAQSKPAPKAAVLAKKVKRAAPAAQRKTKKIVKPAGAGVKQVIQGVKKMATKTQAPFIGTEQFTAAFGDVNARAKDAFEKGAKIAEEIADLTRGNVEAFVASSKVAAKGVETLSQDAAEYGRKSFEDASAALKSFAEVKSATDFFKLQSDYARSAFDAAVAESARVSEAFIKIAGDAAEPITSRYTVAAERVKTLAA